MCAGNGGRESPGGTGASSSVRGALGTCAQVHLRPGSSDAIPSCTGPVTQALSFRNVKEQAAARRVLLSYHPFWLTTALEVVVGKSVDSGG